MIAIHERKVTEDNNLYDIEHCTKGINASGM